MLAYWRVNEQAYFRLPAGPGINMSGNHTINYNETT